MKIILPDDVSKIIHKLTENGYEAYAVGGCVRDSIIHRVPGDWDITTSAKPEQVKMLFRRTIDTGIEHGTVTIMVGKNGYEVTTYRIDGEYEDSRHPKSVEFTSSLREDLRRRDFTINAMAYNDEEGIIDMFGGKEDLSSGTIRCVGDPYERFTEDALRMLRAVRFSAMLGFEIEENTKTAIQKLAPSISKISKERIHAELGKTLLSGHPDYIERAYELGITKVIFPIYDKITDKEIVKALLKKVPDELIFRYAAVMYQVGANETKTMLKELKLDNNTIDGAVSIVSLHGMELSTDEIYIRKQAAKYGVTEFKQALLFEKSFYSVIADMEKESVTESMLEIFMNILKRGDCLTLKELDVKGADLIAYGIKPGREIGVILNEMLGQVLENPQLNDKNLLMTKILKL